MSSFAKDTQSSAAIPPEVRILIEQTVKGVCTKRFGKTLRAAILTGSIARDEATGILQMNTWVLTSDADVFFVFRDSSELPTDDQIVAASLESTELLKEQDVFVEVGCAGVTETFLRSMPRHIATFELKRNGRILCGDPQTIDLVPEFEASAISREDGWRLFANRITEALEALAIADGDLNDRDVRYRTVKLYLDMATSFLVFVGRYEPAYRDRQHRIDLVAATQSFSGLDLRLLADNVSMCTAAKLEGAEIPKSAPKLWQEGVQLANQLWSWELCVLTSADAAQGDAQLMRNWMRQQPLVSVVRGWASAGRRAGWRHCLSQSGRWLKQCLRASPRYFVYDAATAIFFSLADPARVSKNESGAWRPSLGRLPFLETSPPSDVNQWQGAARVVSRNYRQLLETTTA